MNKKLTFHITPGDQAQIVQISFAYDPDAEQVVRRIFDRSYNSEEYAVGQLDANAEVDFWNAPPVIENWTEISIEKAQKLGYA